MESKHSLAKSFKFAFDGIKEGIVKGRNFKIQIVCGVIAFFLGIFLGFSRVEMTILTLVISMVLILELMNTAVEAIVDLVSPEIRDKAKVAKDVSAAAVLVSSVASIVVGILLFTNNL